MQERQTVENMTSILWEGCVVSDTKTEWMSRGRKVHTNDECHTTRKRVVIGLYVRGRSKAVADSTHTAEIAGQPG
jgi:hypothetical protein